MSANSAYSIQFPNAIIQNADEIKEKGILENVFVRFSNGSIYKLVFIDYFHFAEEFMRNYDDFGQGWFAVAGMVFVANITPKSIERAVEIIYENGYFMNVQPFPFNNEIDDSNFKILFPSWYLDAATQMEIEIKGYLENVIVEFAGGLSYALHFEDFITFTQRFAPGARFGAVYIGEPGLVIVSRVKAGILEESIDWLTKQSFFAHLKPVI